jgi:hypothetical protein
MSILGSVFNLYVFHLKLGDNVGFDTSGKLNSNFSIAFHITAVIAAGSAARDFSAKAPAI